MLYLILAKDHIDVNALSIFSQLYPPSHINPAKVL